MTQLNTFNLATTKKEHSNQASANSSTFNSKQFKITTFILVISIIIFNLFFLTKVHAETTNLKPTQAYVVDDYANILNQSFKDKIIQQEQIFQNTKQKPQIVVMTVKSTGNQDITDFSNNLLSKPQWQFGQKGVDNGVLILFAQNKGKNNVRVATGYGVESLLPDLSIYNLFKKNAKLLKSHHNADINKGLENVFDNVSQVLIKQYANGNQPNASHNKFIIGGQTNRQRKLVIEVKPIDLAITFLVIIMIGILTKIGLIASKRDDDYQKQLYWYKHLNNDDLNYRFAKINANHSHWIYANRYRNYHDLTILSFIITGVYASKLNYYPGSFGGGYFSGGSGFTSSGGGGSFGGGGSSF